MWVPVGALCSVQPGGNEAGVGVCVGDGYA